MEEKTMVTVQPKTEIVFNNEEELYIVEHSMDMTYKIECPILDGVYRRLFKKGKKTYPFTFTFKNIEEMERIKWCLKLSEYFLINPDNFYEDETYPQSYKNVIKQFN